ncbi:MAG: ABC transporter permease [Clostridia bacterium]|nr:ABC transporter permease [Clostridia bacterium]
MPHRLRFALKKLLRMALLLLCVSFVAFLLLALSPIDPVQANVGQTALGSMSEEQISRLEEYWGANQPPLRRYGNWLAGALRGEFGDSLLYRRAVTEVIGEKLGSSLLVLLTAWLLSGVLGLSLGVAAGSRRGSVLDRAVKGYCFLLTSTPAFWLGLLLLLIFSVWLGLFPIGFSVPIGAEAASVTLGERLAHAFLPALTLSVSGVAGIALHTREKTVEVMGSDFVLFASARGESRRSLVRRHVLRNVALPALTLQFASLGEIVGASVLVEQVFSYPGLGQAAVTAGLGGDLPLLMGVTVLTAALVFGANFAADLLYGAVDPRIRRGAARK